MSTNYPEFLNRDQAATYLRDRWGQRCSRGLLAKLAVSCDGPVYRLAGRFPQYTLDDLDAWAESRISTPRRATSEARAA